MRINLKEFIERTVKECLSEEEISKEYIYNIAKNTDYETFLDKLDDIAREYYPGSKYNILYRGMNEGDSITDNSFMADFLAHARAYGEWVDGIVITDKVLHFDNNEFNNLRDDFIQIILPSFPKYFDDYDEYEEEIKQRLKQIYNSYIKGDKLSDAMMQLDYSENKVIDFVYDFLVNSSEGYRKISTQKANDFFIPLLSFYGKSKGYNIISFRGSGYYGSEEFVVNDISKYTKLSDIWKSVN